MSEQQSKTPSIVVYSFFEMFVLGFVLTGVERQSLGDDLRAFDCYADAALVQVLIALPFFWKRISLHARTRKMTAALLMVVGIVLFGAGCLLLVTKSQPTPKTMSSITPAPMELPAAKKEARIVVTRFEVAPPRTGTPDGPWWVRLYYKNTGEIPGYAPMIQSTIGLSDGVLATDDLENRKYALLSEAMNSPLPRREQQVEVGQEAWIALPHTISGAEWDAVRAGRKRLYVMIVVRFADDTLSPDQFWVSEFCGSQGDDVGTIQLCGQKTYLHGAHEGTLGRHKASR